MIYIVAGLQFGDEGKGACVNALTHRHNIGCVVRYNGGAQAAHHVVRPDGRSHCFSQFGSGTFYGAMTYLSQFVTIDPIALWSEANALLRDHDLINPLKLLRIHPDAPVVTPWHIAINRMRELARGSARHGSCGRGIGEVRREMIAGREQIYAGDLTNRKVLQKKAKAIRQRLGDETANYMHLSPRDPWRIAFLPFVEGIDTWVKLALLPPEVISRDLPRCENYVFEGAQGFLLDEQYGFHPHTTWSDTTYRQALGLISAYNLPGPIVKIGVLRSYITRHGAGPMPTEIQHNTEFAKGDHNKCDDWQGNFRVGYLDLPLLRYAVNVMHPDILAVTHLDEINGHATVCDHYEVSGQRFMTLLPEDVEHRDGIPSAMTQFVKHCTPIYQHAHASTNHRNLVTRIELATGVRVALRSFGPTAADWWGTED